MGFLLHICLIDFIEIGIVDDNDDNSVEVMDHVQLSARASSCELFSMIPLTTMFTSIQRIDNAVEPKKNKRRRNNCKEEIANFVITINSTFLFSTATRLAIVSPRWHIFICRTKFQIYSKRNVQAILVHRKKPLSTFVKIRNLILSEINCIVTNSEKSKCNFLLIELSLQFMALVRLDVDKSTFCPSNNQSKLFDHKNLATNKL